MTRRLARTADHCVLAIWQSNNRIYNSARERDAAKRERKRVSSQTSEWKPEDELPDPDELRRERRRQRYLTHEKGRKEPPTDRDSNGYSDFRDVIPDYSGRNVEQKVARMAKARFT